MGILAMALGMWMGLAAPCDLGEGAKRARVDGAGEIWVERVDEGEWLVGLVNTGERVISLDVVWEEIGLPLRPKVWGTRARGVVWGGFAEKLAGGGCVVLRVKR